MEGLQLARSIETRPSAAKGELIEIRYSAALRNPLSGDRGMADRFATAHMLPSEEPDADADGIRSALSGNLCRCAGYFPTVDAVLEARAAYRKADNP